MNILAVFHSYNFTHFSSENPKIRRQSASQLDTYEKISALILGVKNPKPKSYLSIQDNYISKKLLSNVEIEIWEKTVPHSKGVVLLFHGYSSEKTSLLKNADYFNQLGYSTILTDFMGCGNSEGYQTTIGFYEAENVETVFNYAKNSNSNIILYGNSMGAASIMRAISEFQLQPQKVIIECPFSSMQQTVENRFQNMGVPTFPMSYMLTFWGGVVNGFWAFRHNPKDYANNISQPTLLMCGAKDKNVKRFEIDSIYNNINSKNKELVIFDNAGHENYINHHKTQWQSAIMSFLNSDN